MSRRTIVLTAPEHLHEPFLSVYMEMQKSRRERGIEPFSSITFATSDGYSVIVTTDEEPKVVRHRLSHEWTVPE